MMQVLVSNTLSKEGESYMHTQIVRIKFQLWAAVSVFDRSNAFALCTFIYDNLVDVYPWQLSNNRGLLSIQKAVWVTQDRTCVTPVIGCVPKERNCGMFGISTLLHFVLLAYCSGQEQRRTGGISTKGSNPGSSR